jgi:hypothetical protein
LRHEQALGEILHRYLTAGAGPRDGGVRPQVVVTVGLDDLTGTAADGAGCPQTEGYRGGQGDGAHRGRGDGIGAAVTDGPAGAGPDNSWHLPVGWAPDGGWDGADAHTAGTTDNATGAGAGGHSDARLDARLGGYAWSDYAGVQQVALARLLACDAAISPQVLGAGGAVLAQGRAVRLFTAEQRRAITTRDKGCAFPGCDIPPAWCEAHHIIWWSDGGVTDIDNGVLLCRRHHVLIHHSRWRIEQDPDGGRPWFIPPAHIDPDRKPRRNNHFHLPDLLTSIKRQ